MMPKNLGDTELKRLHRDWRRKAPEARLAILLDDVQTPFNVGAIVRTAAAERVERLFLTGSAISPGHPKSKKTSLGTERYLEWEQHETAAKAVDAVRAAGYRLVGVELAEGAVPLFEARLDGDVCLAVGHEDRGLSPTVLAACDQIAFVPQLGKVGSLNVAHATAIAVYEVRRRTWA